MAMSKPYPTGQTCIIMHCELCNTDVDVNWFCKNCIKNLCDNCKRMHKKIPSLCNHDIGTIGESRKFKRDVILHCADHEEILQYRCKPCHKDICLKCINVHLKHELVDLNEEGENTLKEFRTMIEAKKKQLAKLDRDMATIDHHIKEYQAISQKSITQITAKYDEVTRLKKSLLKRIEKEQGEATKRMKEQHKVFKDAASTLRKRIEVSEEGVDAHDNLSLVHFIRKETAEINSALIPSLPSPVSLPQPLVVSQAANIDVNKIFGTLNVADELMRTTETTENIHTKRKLRSSLTIVSSFVHNTNVLDNSYVYNIACTGDKKVWIASSGMPLQLVDHTGKIHLSIHLIPQVVYLALPSQGNVMISTCKAEPVETKIKRISPDGSISVFKEMKSCKYVDALTFDSKNNLLCLTEDINEKCMLIKLDTTGKEIWRTSTGIRAFEKSTVCLSPNGNCNVMMGTHICVVRADGKVIERKKFSDQLGTIRTILCDINGYLIVGGRKGKIHILDQEMNCLQTFSLPGQSGVHALAVDREDHLWIGRRDGKVFVAKYLD